jgi:hypothetical protein
MTEDFTYARSHRDWMGYAKGLELTVLHDDGLYRHLRWRGPSCFWFELVTWPGHLYLGGDVHDYAFSRTADMFEFFGAGLSGVKPEDINPDYWAEKITAGEPPREYSPAKFRAAVVDGFLQARHRFPKAMPLWELVREELLLDDVADDQERARAALADFSFFSAVDDRRFEFSDWWDWDIKDWDTHYLRACWAIVWGIGQYRAQTAAAIGGAR